MLEAVRKEMTVTAEAAQEILGAAIEIGRAATEAQTGAEQVAAASQEQSAAAEEAQKAIQEQSIALDQGQQAARALAQLAQLLLTGDAAGAVQQIGATAEELSATIQELSGAAGQILQAVEQIDRGSQLQASATQQSTAALTQIEKSAKRASVLAQTATERVDGLAASLGDGRMAVTALTNGIANVLAQVQASLGQIERLEQSARRIDKIVEKISLVAVQTTMLAVSGAVEAARAGEAGRGFALVSGNIRSLAQEATESADQVKDTVRNIIEQINSVRRNLEHLAESGAAEAEKNRGLLHLPRQNGGQICWPWHRPIVSIQRRAEAIDNAVAETLNGAQQIATAATEASMGGTSGSRGGEPASPRCRGSRSRHRGNRLARRSSEQRKCLKPQRVLSAARRYLTFRSGARNYALPCGGDRRDHQHARRSRVCR